MRANEESKLAWWLVRMLGGLLLTVLGWVLYDIRSEVRLTSERYAEVKQAVSSMNGDIQGLRRAVVSLERRYENPTLGDSNNERLPRATRR